MVESVLMAQWVELAGQLGPVAVLERIEAARDAASAAADQHEADGWQGAAVSMRGVAVSLGVQACQFVELMADVGMPERAGQAPTAPALRRVVPGSVADMRARLMTPFVVRQGA